MWCWRSEEHQEFTQYYITAAHSETHRKNIIYCIISQSSHLNSLNAVRFQAQTAFIMKQEVARFSSYFSWKIREVLTRKHGYKLNFVSSIGRMNGVNADRINSVPGLSCSLGGPPPYFYYGDLLHYCHPSRVPKLRLKYCYWLDT